MDDFMLTEGKCHTITFQSSAVQTNFRLLLKEYFKNRKAAECNYIKFINKSGNKIKGRDFYFISFNCHSVYLKDDRDTDKQIKEFLYYYLENHPDLLKDFMKFNEQLNVFFDQIEIINGQLSIDFQPSDKTITQLIRSLDISIDYQDDDFVPNYIMRDFLIKALLDMNILDKSVFLLISYPEADIGIKDFSSAMDYLNDLNVTTLIITANDNILTSVAEENMFLVHDNGAIYDIITLREELLQLKVVDRTLASDLSKRLAYQDFKKDYFLLDYDLKQFLLSNKL